jgi:hypothetical protein
MTKNLSSVFAALPFTSVVGCFEMQISKGGSPGVHPRCLLKLF